MKIVPLDSKGVDEASRLIEEVSDALTSSDFTESGYQKFKEMVLYEGMIKNLQEGYRYWAAYEDEIMVGIIAIKPPSHLFNLFVHADHHHKGIATQLWQHMLRELNPQSITLYSSTYALDLYRKLGCKISGEKIENEEITCYPMTWNADE